MKQILLILLLPLFTFSQKVDTIITTSIYKSYFNYKLKQPLYVAYDLYKGGGDCDRTKFHFYNDTKVNTATLKDYAHNGYDQGHLANAEDFAYDCIKDELTFRFYNCLPQTPNLNRGIWKHWEEIVRAESQKDTLRVICGGQFKTKLKMGTTAIPDHCWKVVVKKATGKVIHVLYFTNDMELNIVKEMTLLELENILGYIILTH
jgi:endonuclease G